MAITPRIKGNNMENTIEKDDHGKSQAAAQYESIWNLVKALECDFARLEELRDELLNLKATYTDCIDDTAAFGLAKEAKNALNQWLEENEEELFELTRDAGEFTSREQVEDHIQDDPLSVDVRSDWHSPGGEGSTPSEFQVLLCTGGPAVRIIGELDEYGQPYRAWIEYQDWGTPWTQYFDASQDTLLTYCQQFYFGE